VSPECPLRCFGALPAGEGPWLAGGFRNRYARDLAPARCRFRSLHWAPLRGDPLLSLHRPLCGTPRIAPGPPTDSILATGRTMGEAGRRRRGAVRLSAAVQVHRTASHERSPPPRLRSETRARPGGRSSTQGEFHLPHVRVGVELPPKSPVVHVPDGPEHLSLPPGPVMLPETPGDASSTGTTTSLPPWRRRY